MFHSQVVDHGLDLTIVSLALIRYSRIVKLLALGFETAVACYKVSPSVRVHGCLPSVGAGRIRALWVESSFVGSTVGLR